MIAGRTALRALALVFCAALAAALASCASTPEAPAGRDADAKTFTAHPGAATLYVYRSPVNREQNDDDTVLYIDNRVIGATVPGTYFRVNLPPGKHQLHGIGYDTGKLALDARPGTLYFVELSVAAGTSNFRLVPPDQAQREIDRCCALLENWAPGQRPLLR